MLNKLTVTYYLLENSVHKYINLGCLPFLQELSAHNFENNCRYIIMGHMVRVVFTINMW